MNDQDLIGIVSELNSEVFEAGLEEHSFFTFGSDGSNSWVEFAGHPLWDLDNDLRPWLPGEEEGSEEHQEELGLWLRKEARKIVDALSQLWLCRPKVVCLCGSTRYPDLHHKVMMEETLAGHIVLPLGVYGHADYPPGAKTLTCDSDPTTPVKAALDLLHRRKIETADEILVISPENKWGEGTQEDIEYAEELGKPVRFWIPSNETKS